MKTFKPDDICFIIHQEGIVYDVRYRYLYNWVLVDGSNRTFIHTEHPETLDFLNNEIIIHLFLKPTIHSSRYKPSELLNEVLLDLGFNNS